MELIAIKNQEYYSLERASEITGLSPVQIQYWIKTKNIPVDENRRVQGHYLVAMLDWQERKNVEDSTPGTSREKFFKLVKQLSFLANSREGGILFGDFRVNDCYRDIVELLERFANCYSVQRITKNKNEIYEEISNARSSYGDEVDFSQFQGNFTESDLVDLYYKMMRSEVIRSGRAAAMERFKEFIDEYIEEEGYDCQVEYKDKENGMLMVKLSGPDANEVAREHITDPFNSRRYVELSYNTYLVVF